MKLALIGVTTACAVTLFPAPLGKSEPFSYPVSIVTQYPSKQAVEARLGASERASRNRSLARQLARPFGWASGKQWGCLVELWHRESRWLEDAKNKTSGAFGIPQKMGTPIQSPTKQIMWGLNYIKDRHGTPCKAVKFHDARGWY